MQANKKPTTIETSITVYATFDLSELKDWFDQRAGQEEPEDCWALHGRYGEFLSIVGDDDTVKEYLRDGGNVDDCNVDQDAYLDHCFETFE